MMSGIRGTDTKPEIMLRKALYKRGFRYRLHDKGLPGKPDLVFPARRAVMFAHGCFWHRHDCHLFKWPGTREDFWRKKIEGNVERDRKNHVALRAARWRVACVWECALKGKHRLPFEEVIDACVEWLEGDADELEIRGNG